MKNDRISIMVFGHREEMKQSVTVGRKETVQKGAMNAAVTANEKGKPDDAF